MGSTEQKTNKITASKEFYKLGTINRLRIYGEDCTGAINEAVIRLCDIEDKMSVFKASSEVSGINMKAGYGPQEVSWDTFYVIKRAVEYSALSKGVFDPTVRPLVDLWGIGTKYAAVPDKESIQGRMKLVNYRDIILDGSSSTVKLKQHSQAIDLGAIAKGYAADEVKRVFQRHGISSAIIDLGGNISAVGTKPDGTLWNIGIQDPFGKRGEYIGVLKVSEKSVVTSGNYERYFIEDNQKFHHIIDPRVGYPSNSGVISATIISDNSVDADALATCAYIMGLEEGIEFLESQEGADGILITENKEVYVTSGIRKDFVLLKKDYSFGQMVRYDV